MRGETTRTLRRRRWYPGATGVAGAAQLSGGASQETWAFDIVHPDGDLGAILRRAPPGYGASPGRAAGLDAEAVLMQLALRRRRAVAARAACAGARRTNSAPASSWQRVEGETIPRKILRDAQFA